MIRRIPVLLFLAAALVAVGCGGGGGESPASVTVGEAAATESAPAASSDSMTTADPVDASRFLFGASPGKPVVYWIHTDW